MKKILSILAGLSFGCSTVFVTSCSLNFNNKPSKQQNTSEIEDGADEINPNDDENFKSFYEHKQKLDSYNKGAEYKSYDTYINNVFNDRGYKLSRYTPTNIFLHENDQVQVFLNQSKTSTTDFNFIKNQGSGIFAVGLDGSWSATFDPYLDSSYVEPDENSYWKSKSRVGITFTSVNVSDNYYVLSFTTKVYGILYKHIASELAIEKILINGIENDTSRISLVYESTKNNPKTLNDARKFWKIAYEKFDAFKANDYNSQLQIVHQTPAVIFKGNHFNYIIDIIKFFLCIATAQNNGIDYHNSNLNNFLKATDLAYEMQSEINGIDANGIGDTAYEFPFQIENVVLNDAGAGALYASNEFLSLHSNLKGKALDFKDALKSKSKFYTNQVFSNTFTGKNGKGFLHTDADYINDLKNHYTQSYWGIMHEFGHTFQNPTYKLSKWGEVTVNIGPIGIAQKLYKKNLINRDKNFYDIIKERKSFIQMNPNFLSKKIRKNALYENPLSGKINYDSTNSQTLESTNDVELVFWTQLMLGLGDGFIPALNNYYRANKAALVKLTKKIEVEHSANSASFGGNYNATSHAKLDVLIGVITTLTKTNLKTFFESWGLSIQPKTLSQMQDYGKDYGSDLYKIIFDKDYSGFSDQNIWIKNMDGGFLINNISEKLSDFGNWGTFNGKDSFFSSTSNYWVEINESVYHGAIWMNYKNLHNENITYGINENITASTNFASNYAAYLKIRGSTGGGAQANKYSFHLLADKTNKVIISTAFTSWIDMGSGAFVKIDLFDINGLLVNDLNVYGTNTSLIKESVDWSFESGYELVVTFTNDNFKVKNNSADGTRMFDFSTKQFIPIETNVKNRVFRLKL